MVHIFVHPCVNDGHKYIVFYWEWAPWHFRCCHCIEKSTTNGVNLCCFFVCLFVFFFQNIEQIIIEFGMSSQLSYDKSESGSGSWKGWPSYQTWIRGAFQNTFELLNLRALKISMLYNNWIFQCMGKIFCVEFERVPLKFHTKYLTHTFKDVHFIHGGKFNSS